MQSAKYKVQRVARRSRTLCALLFALCSLLRCAAIPREVSPPLRGELVLEIDPNPIVAEKVGEDIYDFPFDIVMREAGGVGVTIEEFTVEVSLARLARVFSQTFPVAEITRRGYPAEVDAGQYLRFNFRTRKSVSSDLMFRGVTAAITVRTIDRNGWRGVSRTRVSVRRR